VGSWVKVSGGTCCCPEKSHGDEGFLRDVFLVQGMKVKAAAGRWNLPPVNRPRSFRRVANTQNRISISFLSS
jgi:hypothetical protein